MQNTNQGFIRTPKKEKNKKKKHILSPEEQTAYLYWRALIKFEGSLKRRHELYPNQLYRHITSKSYKNETAAEAELEKIFEYTIIKTKYGRKKHYTKYKEEEDFLRQRCRGADLRRTNNDDWA